MMTSRHDDDGAGAGSARHYRMMIEALGFVGRDVERQFPSIVDE